MSTTSQNVVKEVKGVRLYYMGDVAVLEMNRGENRLNAEFLDAMDTMLDEVIR